MGNGTATPNNSPADGSFQPITVSFADRLLFLGVVGVDGLDPKAANRTEVHRTFFLRTGIAHGERCMVSLIFEVCFQALRVGDLNQHSQIGPGGISLPVRSFIIQQQTYLLPIFTVSQYLAEAGDCIDDIPVFRTVAESPMVYHLCINGRDIQAAVIIELICLRLHAGCRDADGIQFGQAGMGVVGTEVETDAAYRIAMFVGHFDGIVCIVPVLRTAYRGITDFHRIAQETDIGQPRNFNIVGKDAARIINVETFGVTTSQFSLIVVIVSVRT